VAGGMKGKSVGVKDFCATCYRKNGSGTEERNIKNRVQINLSAAEIIFKGDGTIDSVEGYRYGEDFFSDENHRLVLLECSYQLLINPWQA
jgi:hypothetical protein